MKRVLERVLAKVRERRDAKRHQAEIQREKERGRQKAQRQRRALLAELDKATDPDHRKALRREIAELHRKASRRHAEANHARERAHELASKIAWGVKRATVLRRKIREADQQSPTPEPWHGNGHEWANLTPRAKALLAIAVVRYGLYCTSITRGWGTGSFHEDVPTRGFDCGGPRMTDFQRDLRYGRIDGFALGDLLELFGPDNAACADNGAAYAMSEGSGIESLHDNHTHAFVY